MEWLPYSGLQGDSLLENPFGELKKRVRERAIETFSEIGIEIEDIEVKETEREFGDLTITKCFELAKNLRRSPREIALEFASSFKGDDLIERVEVAGPGYLNFWGSPLYLREVVESALQLERSFGKSRFGSGKEICVEHTSVNPTGPIHIGRARNSALGDSLSRIYSFLGYKVHREYYVNDLGRQVAILVWYYLKSGGNFEEAGNKRGDLFVWDFYVKGNEELERLGEEGEREIREIMKRYEEGKDEELREVFRRLVQSCLDGYEEVLGELGVKFDSFQWESEISWESSARKVIEELLRRGICKKDEEGALYIDGSELGRDKIYLTRGDGTTLYRTRDLAYCIKKAEKFHFYVNVLGEDHKQEVAELNYLLEILGIKKPLVLFYSYVSLPEGKMSTRKGKVVLLHDVIEESIRRARGVIEEKRRDKDEEFKEKVSREIGRSAVRFALVRISPEKPVIFKWEEVLDFEKQGAPFLIYSLVRAKGIIRKASELGFTPREFDPSFCSESEILLIKEMGKFPERVLEAGREMKPSIIATYSLNLAELFNQFYRDSPVISSEKNVAESRLCVVRAFEFVMGNSLWLLGLPELEEM